MPSRATTPRVDAPAKQIVRSRHLGRWLGGLAAAAVLALIVVAFARADIEYSIIPRYMFSSIILEGLRNTIGLTLMCMTVGVVLGVIFAVMRQSANPVLRWIAALYIWFFRATPVLVQLLIWFNLAIVFKTIAIPGVASWSTNTVMTPLVAAVLGLGINEGSYMSEIVRAGLLSVGRGQVDAARALGLSGHQTMRRIVLPQALRVIIPPTGNEFISMLKYTSLAYVIAYTELLGSAYKVYSSNLKVIELLFAVSIWYVILTSLFMLVQQQVERHYDPENSSRLPTLRLRWVRQIRMGRDL